jgi:HAD superfamily hydrolase (TIGR01509 family)
MIKAVIFDMDGVIIDARDWHFGALNSALELFGESITYQDHLDRFDGLPTKTKLKMLSQDSRVPQHLHKIIEAIKQERTLRQAAHLCFPKLEHLLLISWLKKNGQKVGLATNSVKQTTFAMLGFAGLANEFDVILTNEDVVSSKPDPEIYLKSCQLLGLKPAEVLVVEDNINGINAAKSAGCLVVEVASPSEVTIALLAPYLELEGNKHD